MFLVHLFSFQRSSCALYSRISLGDPIKYALVISYHLHNSSVNNNFKNLFKLRENPVWGFHYYNI